MTTDGRVLRGERTRQALVAALLDLLEEGEPRPRARQVADRAGVSLRTVFQHFEDLDALHAAVVAYQSERVRPVVASLVSEGDLEERIRALVAQRARLYELVAPARRALDDSTRRSAVITAAMQDLDEVLRAQLTQHFAPELRAAGRGRRRLLAALEAATSFPLWQQLRDTQRESTAASTAAMAMLVRGALSDACPT